ncbi:MAG: helix-turn-helix transcriptional regulator [Candidatus Eremiobacteraeota bacterium]|nr:helix-turn-helix transcriptional regulator [Candidatus Eremiobacteraeota bacterium]
MTPPYDRLQHGSRESPPGESRFVAALTSLGRHPNAAIIRALEAGPLRFTEIVAGLTHVREDTVSSSLRELDDDGIVRRDVDAGPPLRVLYRMTPLGAEIAPSLRKLADWVERVR